MAEQSTGKTGTSDVTYNLVSILYHALQGAETYDQYIRDAEQRGDTDLAQFFVIRRRKTGGAQTEPRNCWKKTSVKPSDVGRAILWVQRLTRCMPDSERFANRGFVLELAPAVICALVILVIRAVDIA